MINLAKIVQETMVRQQEAGRGHEAPVIENLTVTADRPYHIHRRVVYHNCRFNIRPHNGTLFILTEDADATFENCVFEGTLVRAARDEHSHHSPVFYVPEEATLTFLNCEMHNPDTFIESHGAVTLQGCRVSYDGTAEVGDEAFFAPPRLDCEAELRQAQKEYWALQDSLDQELGTEGKFPPSRLSCCLLNAYGEDTLVKDCTFFCKVGPEYSASLFAYHGTLQHCTVNGFRDVRTEVIEGCTIENCGTVQVSCVDGENLLENSTIRGCYDLWVEEGQVSNCKISDIRKSIWLNHTDMDDCTLTDLQRDQAGDLIDLDGGEISDCEFRNVKLTKGAQLIGGNNGAEVTDCRFLNCRTDRRDLQLVWGSEPSGFIFKHFEDVDICSGCEGLDEVIPLEEWETD